MTAFSKITLRRWVLAFSVGVLATALLVVVTSAAPGRAATNTIYRIGGVAPVGPDQHVVFSIANVAPTTCSASLRLVDQNGTTVQKASVSVPPNQGAAMTFVPPPGAVVSVRPVVVSVGDSCTAFIPSLELVNGPGQTAVAATGFDTIG